MNWLAITNQRIKENRKFKNIRELIAINGEIDLSRYFGENDPILVSEYRDMYNSIREGVYAEYGLYLALQDMNFNPEMVSRHMWLIPEDENYEFVEVAKLVPNHINDLSLAVGFMSDDLVAYRCQLLKNLQIVINPPVSQLSGMPLTRDVLKLPYVHNPTSEFNSGFRCGVVVFDDVLSDKECILNSFNDNTPINDLLVMADHLLKTNAIKSIRKIFRLLGPKYYSEFKYQPYRISALEAMIG